MMLDLALTYPRVPRQRGAGEDRRDHGGRVLRQGLPGRAEPRARRSTTPAPTSTGSRRWRWTTRCTRIFDAYRGQVAEARRPGRLSRRMMLLALKIDVDTLRGTREGVPNCCAMLRRHGAGATFLFCLGPDHTGRAIKRVFRPGFFGKVRRTSVLEHYGLRTLLYGTLLPGPDIGRRAARRDARGARRRLRGRHPLLGPRPLAGRRRARATPRGRARDAARVRALHRHLRHGAAHARRRRLADERARAAPRRSALGFDYCSDGRGTHPYLPVWHDGQPFARSSRRRCRRSTS